MSPAASLASLKPMSLVLTKTCRGVLYQVLLGRFIMCRYDARPYIISSCCILRVFPSLHNTCKNTVCTLDDNTSVALIFRNVFHSGAVWWYTPFPNALISNVLTEMNILWMHLFRKVHLNALLVVHSWKAALKCISECTLWNDSVYSKRWILECT